MGDFWSINRIGGRQFVGPFVLGLAAALLHKSYGGRRCLVNRIGVERFSMFPLRSLSVPALYQYGNGTGNNVAPCIAIRELRLS